ncbi:phage tail tape measure protein [Vibrio crassostreae 9CS106]|uniref:Phage tail tape measure protein n=1 Tax=Vibrio crassostreae 9CS106 TaxID=1191300 RepID=A0A1B1C375_9VIBR|nr:phage tail tape measure protein [Vibrio crassostreae 9CS106]
MATERDALVKLIIEGENLLSPEINEAVIDLDRLAKESKSAKDELRQLEKSQETISSFDELEKSVTETSDALIRAQVEAKATSRAMRQAGDDVDESMVEANERAKLAVSETRKELNAQNKELKKAQSELKKMGVSTEEAAQAEADLAKRIVESKARITELNTTYRDQQSNSQALIITKQEELRARKENVNQMELEEDVVKELTSIANRQLTTLAKVSGEIDKEAVSHKRVSDAIEGERAARVRNIETLDQSVIKAKAERDAIAKTEKSMEKYSNEYDQLVRSRERGDISLKKMIAEEEKLKKALGLTSAQVKEKKRNIEAVARDEERSAAATNKAADAERKKEVDLQNVEAALVQYRIELEKLNKAKSKGEISTEQYIRAEDKLKKTLNLTAAQAATEKKAIEAGASAKRGAAGNTDILTTATRRLAQAYTVLLAAQKSVQGAVESVKSYGEYEAALTGVSKTTELTAQELDELGDIVTELSTKVSGTAVDSLLKYGEAAGQMGVEGTQNLTDMIIAADALASATDLAGDEAARAMLRIQEVTGDAEDGIHAIASSVVELGNSYKLTESELLDFTKEIAAGTSNVDLSTSALLGMGAAMRQIGLPAERTRSTLSRTFSTIQESIAGSAEQMEYLSKIVGDTAENIERDLGEMPEKVFMDFLDGLKRMGEEGSTTKDIMAAFGVTSIETVDTLNVLTTQVDTMRQAVLLSGSAYEEQNAHLQEASKFYATQQQEMQRTINRLKELAKAIGEAYSSDTQEALQKVVDLLNEFDTTIIKAAENAGLLFEGTASLTEGVARFGMALDGLIPNLSLTEILFQTMRGAANYTTIALNTAALSMNALSGEVAEFFGASEEEMMKYQKRSESLHASILQDQKDIAEASNIAAGKASVAYYKLRDAALENHKAVKDLTDAERLAINEIINKVGYMEDEDEVYRLLTAKIQQKVREQKVEAGLNEITGKSIDKVTGFLNRNGIAYQQSTDSIKENTDATKENSLAQDEAATKTISLSEARNKASAVARESAQSAEDEANSLSKLELAEQRVNIQIEEKIAKIAVAIQSGQSYAKQQQELTDLYERQQKIQADLAIEQEIYNATASSSVQIVEKYANKQKDLQKAFLDGKLTVGEYTEKNKVLTSVIRQLTPLLTEEQKEILGIGTAAKQTARDIEMLRRAKELDAITSKTAAVTAVEYQKQLIEVNKKWEDGSISLKDYTEQKNFLTGAITKIIPVLTEEEKKIIASGAAISKNEKGVKTLVKEHNKLANSSKDVADAFYLQEAAAKSLGETINDSIDKTAQATDKMTKGIKGANTALSAAGKVSVSLGGIVKDLDDSSLSNLTDEAEKAQQAFKELKGEALDAADSIQERYDEMTLSDEENLTKDYEKEIKDIQELLKAAMEENDIELQKRLIKAKKQLEEMRDLEMEEVKRRKDSEVDSGLVDGAIPRPTPMPYLDNEIFEKLADALEKLNVSASVSAGGGKTHTVDLNIGGEKLSVQLSNEESVSNLLDVLSKIGGNTL